jgi:hypothetical protein
MSGEFEGWLPTVDNINALPKPIKSYIHDLVSECDPANLVRENVMLREQVAALQIKIMDLKERCDTVAGF